MECKDCLGTGIIAVNMIDDEPCEKCNGTGQIEDVRAPSPGTTLSKLIFKRSCC